MSMQSEIVRRIYQTCYHQLAMSPVVNWFDESVNFYCPASANQRHFSRAASWLAVARRPFNLRRLWTWRPFTRKARMQLNRSPLKPQRAVDPYKQFTSEGSLPKGIWLENRWPEGHLPWRAFDAKAGYRRIIGIGFMSLMSQLIAIYLPNCTYFHHEVKNSKCVMLKFHLRSLHVSKQIQ